MMGLRMSDKPFEYDDSDDAPPPDGGIAMSTGVGSDRVGVLIATGRWADAEKELRRLLTSDPQSAFLHARLAFVLVVQDRHQEATDEARHAIGLDPELPFAHHALAMALLERGRPDEAIAAVGEAMRLDPYEADYHGLRAAAYVGKSDWATALRSADAGLALEPDHDACRNFRSLALRQLGRRDEADATTRGTLRRRPDDAFAHANQGWSALHARDYAAAQTHFREALRLDPNQNYAREGILEALKAKNPLYRGLLRWKLWMSTLSGGKQWAVVIGLYVLYRLSASAARNTPALKPLLYPVMGLYLVFVLMTWLGDPIFDSLLRLNKFGRLALTDNRRRASNVLLAALALLGVSAAVVFATGQLWWLAPVLLVAPVMLFATKIWQAEPGWPRWAMLGYVALAAALAIGCGALFAAQGGFVEGEAISAEVTALFVLYLLAQAIGWFLVNFLIAARPKR